MRCPSCGASAQGAYCEYCGNKLPAERVETQSIHADHVVVNNYYYPEGHATHRGSGSATNHARMSVNIGTSASPKSRLLALLLCLFLGMFGAHRFYVGRYGLGLLFFFTIGFLGIGWLIDLVLVLLGRMRDRYGLPVTNW